MLPRLVRLFSHPHLATAGLYVPYSDSELFFLCQTLQMEIVTGLISKLTTNCLLKKGDCLLELTSSQFKIYFKNNSWIAKYKKILLSFLLGLKLLYSEIYVYPDSPIIWCSSKSTPYCWGSLLLVILVWYIDFTSNLTCKDRFTCIFLYWHIHLYFPQA